MSMNLALDSSLLISFCMTVAVIVIVPGPSVLFIVSRALTVGRSGAIAAATGDSLGQTVQGLLAACGIGALVAESEVLYNVIKFGGALYLLWMGVMTLKHRQFAASGASSTEVVERRAELRKGFIVGATNPKTIVFFIAALPQFVDHQRGNVLVQMLVLLFIYGLLGWAADTMWGIAGGSIRNWSATAPRRIERLIGGGGLCIIGVGAWLALSHGAM
jgi:threonine/homoserine/homoserine lactone efflux protein